jgi:hypothetical protein
MRRLEIKKCQAELVEAGMLHQNPPSTSSG